MVSYSVEDLNNIANLVLGERQVQAMLDDKMFNRPNIINICIIRLFDMNYNPLSDELTVKLHRMSHDLRHHGKLKFS